MQTQNDCVFAFTCWKVSETKGKIFVCMKISQIGSLCEIKMHMKYSCFTVWGRRTLAIDNLRISHNASGMGANIRVLVT